MAAAVEALYDFKLTVNETLALGLTHVTDPTVERKIDPGAGTLKASTTPAVTKAYDETITLAGGVGAIDLTSLAGPESTTTTFNGLKVQLVKLSCPSTNTGGITVDRAAATPYNLFGADNVSAEQVEVLPGGAMMMYHDDESEDVDATHKDVQLAGTGTDQIRVQLVAG